MMRQKIKTVFLVLAALAAANTFAGGSLPGRTITKVAFQGDGFYLYSSELWADYGCDKRDAVVLLASDPNYEKAYALLLAAYSSGKKVSGWSDGCNASFDGNSYSTIRGYKYLVVE